MISEECGSTLSGGRLRNMSKRVSLTDEESSRISGETALMTAFMLAEWKYGMCDCMYARASLRVEEE